jgi:hypothetical protein
MKTNVLRAKRLKQNGKLRLPVEIWLKVLNYEVFELRYVNRFFHTLVKNNINDICYNIIKNYKPKFTIIHKDSAYIYAYYCKQNLNRKFIIEYDIYNESGIWNMYIDNAVSTKNMKIVGFLFSNFKECFIKKSRYETILTTAIIRDNLEVVKYVIDNDLIDINKNGLYEFTVMEAIDYDRLSILKYLISADVKKKTDMLFSSDEILRLAIKETSLKIIKYLVKSRDSIPMRFILDVKCPNCTHSPGSKYREVLKYIISSGVKMVDSI